MLIAECTYAVVALDQPKYRGLRVEAHEDAGAELAHVDPGLGLVLHYHVPHELEGAVEPGQLVIVPLRGRQAYGVVVEMAVSSPVGVTQPVLRVVDRKPVLSHAMLSLARWIASHYRCTLWQALAPMLPPGVARRAVTTVGLSSGVASSPLIAALGRRHKQVVSLLESAPKSTMSLHKLRRGYSGPVSRLNSTISDLERKGVVTRRTELPAPRSKPKEERVISLAVDADAAYEALREASQRAPLQAAALAWLLKRPEGGWQPLRDLYLHTGATSSTVLALQRKGLIELDQRPVYRRPVPAVASSPTDEPPTLTAAQAAAWREIAAALRGSRESGHEMHDGRPTKDQRARAKDSYGAASSITQNSKLKTQNCYPTPDSRLPTPVLLHGVTGSGKTEIYLRAIGMALRMGRQALVLVPEISLTPQAVHRFASRFPGRVALIHSQLSPGQQFDEWRRIQEGHADIVVGSRSAVFAPLPRLGLVVVDEEHEWAYKQDHAPRYHARDVALKRAELAGALVILGSATPALETYHRAQQGEYKLLSLPTRVGRRRGRGGSDLITELPMPPVQVVDMRAELRTGNRSIFSRPLQSALDSALARREQAILYLNRRGSHSFMLCRSCGHVPLCGRCDVPLVYHADVYEMLCHRCNAHSLTPRECPRCGSTMIRGFGIGTQRVVDEVNALFPKARVLRWDRDTASRQGGHESIMEMFMRGEADVLVGTQMIAKGLDIPRVTLVGAVGADTGLYLPDFRAPERTLQLLMQVAGRAGRRTETAHSHVIVQTYNPEHYAIEAAAQHDYKGFYAGEIRFRAEHGYPPYGQLARLVYSSTSDERCEREAEVVARYLRRKAERLAAGKVRSPLSHAQSLGPLDAQDHDIDVLGPVPCFVHKVRGRYRWQVLVRAGDVGPLLEGFYPGPGWAVDVDPMSTL